MRTIVILCLLLGMSGAARAERIFLLEPPTVHAGAIVNLYVDETEDHCFSALQPFVLRDGNLVTVRFEIADFNPPGTPPGTCPPDRVTPQRHSLGVFAPGQYEVQVIACANPPPPLPECVLQATLPLTVLGVRETRFTVPALSADIAIALAVALMAIGVFAVRRE
jgi:hypothetical protein